MDISKENIDLVCLNFAISQLENHFIRIKRDRDAYGYHRTISIIVWSQGSKNDFTKIKLAGYHLFDH